MAQEQEIKSKRLQMEERLKGKHPEAELTDEEAIFGRINDDYDAYEDELAGYKEREGKFAEMFTSDPRSARLMMEWRDGDDPAVALVRLYGEDIREALDDPEKQEAIAEANREFMERVAHEKEYEQQHTQNLQESLANIEKAQQEMGLTDEQIDEAMSWIIGIAKDAMLGKFTPETIALAIKAQHYDNDLAEAGAAGEVRGRNAKVKETLRRPSGGDGTASLGGKNAAGVGRQRDLPDLGAMERFGEGNMNIFERGGEKRTPIRR